MPLTPEEKKFYLESKGLNPEEYDFEEFGAGSQPTEQPTSGLEALGKSALRSIAPTAAMLGGMRLGAKVPGGAIPKAIGSLAGGLASAYVGGDIQEKALEYLQGIEPYKEGVNRLNKLKEEHPILSTVGDLLPSVPVFGSTSGLAELGKIFQPSTISKKVLGNVAANVGLQAGAEGVREAVTGEDLSPARIATTGLSGVVLNSPTKLGEKILGPNFRTSTLQEFEPYVGPIKKPEVKTEINTPETPTSKPESSYLSQQEGIEQLRKELQGKEVKPSLENGKSSDVVRGEPENRPQVEEEFTPDPTEKFYQETPENPYVKIPEGGKVKSVPFFGIENERAAYLRDYTGNSSALLRELKDMDAVERGQKFVKDGPQYDPNTGERLLQPAGEGSNLTPKQYTEAQKLASKRGVELSQEPSIISEVTNKEARGYAIPSDRSAVVNPNLATSDTPAHEIGHNYIRDLRDSNNPRDVEFYNKGIRAAGSEEKLVEALGKRVSDIDNRPLRTWVDDALNYTGSKLGLTEENTVNQLGRRLRDDRPFNESPELHKGLAENFKEKFYSEANNESSPQGGGTSKGTSIFKDGINLGFLKPAVDSIAEHSPVAGKAVEEAVRDTSRLNGQFTNQFIEAAKKLKEPQKVARYLYEKRHNLPSTVILNPNDSKIVNGPLLSKWREVHQEQINRGLEVKIYDPEGKVIGKRDPVSKENIVGPEVISKATLDTLLHQTQTSVNRQKLIKDWIDHRLQSKLAKTKVEAQEQFNDFMRGFSAAGEKKNTAATNALRQAEGEGVPWSWVEKNPVEAYRTYGNRISRDLAYWKNIESNPEVSALFGHKKVEGIEPLGGDDIKVAQKILTGTHSEKETIYSSVESFVRSLILGPVTGVKNTVSTLAQILPYIPARDIPKIATAIGDIKKGFIDSMKMGVNRHSITRLETGDVSGMGRFAENLNKLSDIIRKFSGSNAIEQWTRAHNMALGEILTESYWGRAAKGDINARKFLRQFAPGGESLDFRNLSQLPQSVKLETAARFVERVQGTYGLRGLPSFLLEPSSPVYWFMSLAKWSTEKANVITKDVINPALTQGDFGPMIRYGLGGLLTGEMVREITKLMNGGKKANTPDIEEVRDKGDWTDYAFKLGELSSLSGLGGMYSDLLKAGVNLGFGKGYSQQGFTIPSAELVSSISQEIGNASRAVEEGQDKFKVVLSLMENILTDNIQALRMVDNNLEGEDIDRANKFRDKRIYDKLEGKNVQPPQGRTDRYHNQSETAFKRAKTTEEGKQIYKEELKPRLEGMNKEDRKKEVSALKKNSYQVVPSDPKEAREYLQYIRRTQGVDAMVKLKKDKEAQDRVNKQKTRMVR